MHQESEGQRLGHEESEFHVAFGRNQPAAAPSLLCRTPLNNEAREPPAPARLSAKEAVVVGVGHVRAQAWQHVTTPLPSHPTTHRVQRQGTVLGRDLKERQLLDFKRHSKHTS